MQRWQNLPGVLKNKARIYVWLLVGLVPVWAYGLTERFTKPDWVLNSLCLLLAALAVMASFWIVVWRWEVIEQRRLPRRVRVLLLALSGFTVFLFGLFCCVALAVLGGLRTSWPE